MRRPIHPSVLSRLVDAADALDCQIELALLRAGIVGDVPPDRVRQLLCHAELEVHGGFDAANQRRLSFWCGGTLIGVIEHDGTLMHAATISDDASVAERSTIAAI